MKVNFETTENGGARLVVEGSKEDVLSIQNWILMNAQDFVKGIKTATKEETE